jgi:hypothetical protein
VTSKRAKVEFFNDLFDVAYVAADGFEQATEELRRIAEALPDFKSRQVVRTYLLSAADRLEDICQPLRRELDRADADPKNVRAIGALAKLAVGGLSLLPAIVGGAAGGAVEALVHDAIAVATTTRDMSDAIAQHPSYMSRGTVLQVEPTIGSTPDGAIMLRVLWQDGTVAERNLLSFTEPGSRRPTGGIGVSAFLWLGESHAESHGVDVLTSGQVGAIEVRPRFGDPDAGPVLSRVGVGATIFVGDVR